jgi:serine protease Do
VAVAQGANNIGFSIPINIVKEGLNQFKNTGKFPAKAFLGVEYQMISEQAALLNEVPQGVYVVGVIADSPAEKAGIKEGDIITKVNGENLTEESGGLARLVSGKKPGDEVKLEVWRNKETMNVSVTLTEANQ